MKQALVLVPGLGGDSELWRHQLEHLADVAEMQVADLSPCSTREEMADAVLRSAPEKFALAGMSMGGWTAQEVAARAPQRVTKVALICTWANPDPAFNEKQREVIRRIRAGEFEKVCEEHRLGILNPPHRKNTALKATMAEMQRRAGPELMARHIQAMIDGYDSRACLPKIRCPTLVVAGRNDPLFSVEEHAFITASIGGARLAIIEDCGHAVNLEQPQALTALLRYWLEYL